MTNLPTFTDLAKMVLIFEKEHSVLVTDNKTCKINAYMSFEVLAKKGKYKNDQNLKKQKLSKVVRIIPEPIQCQKLDFK